MEKIVQVIKDKIDSTNYQLSIVKITKRKLSKIVLDPIFLCTITSEEIKLLKEICNLNDIDKLENSISTAKQNRINYRSNFMKNIKVLLTNIINELIFYIDANKIKQEKLNLILVSIENNIPIISPEYRHILKEVLKEANISDEDIINVLNMIAPINDNSFKSKK